MAIVINRFINILGIIVGICAIKTAITTLSVKHFVIGGFIIITSVFFLCYSFKRKR